MWLDDRFPVWRNASAMVLAGLAIVGAWALTTDEPGRALLDLVWIAALPLALPIVDTMARFLADIARWVWEREYWRNRPPHDDPKPTGSSAAHTPLESAADTDLPLEDAGIAYTVMGRLMPSLPRLSPEELRDLQWRRACRSFLQAGHALGDTWNFRAMKAAGLLERSDWDLIVGVLKRAALLTAVPGEGTRPYPDYATALARLLSGCPLPYPAEGPLPVVARQHNTARAAQPAQPHSGAQGHGEA